MAEEIKKNFRVKFYKNDAILVHTQNKRKNMCVKFLNALNEKNITFENRENNQE